MQADQRGRGRLKEEGMTGMPSTHRASKTMPEYRSGHLAQHLRRILQVKLLNGGCSATTAAHLLSIHRRTLYRHLREEGSAFRELSNEVRFGLACELLENTDMAVSQIAAVLRYSELSAFTRAFQRWSGQSPSAWRTRRSSAQRRRLTPIDKQC